MSSVGAVGARASLLAAVSLVACGEPPVNARAVWIDEFTQTDGTRRLHVYDRGDVEPLPLVMPADVPLLRAQLGPRGRGLLIRGRGTDATYVDLADARHLPLALTEAPNNVPDPVQFSEVGDALHWRRADQLFVVPLMPGAALEWSAEGPWLAPLQVPLSGTGWVVSAPSAPILFALDTSSFWSEGMMQAQGQIVAFRYSDPRTGAAELTELARWNHPGPTFLRRQQDCTEALLCGADWVIDPAGETLTLDEDVSDVSCRFRRWRWRDGSKGECVSVPPELFQTTNLLGLVAAIDDDVLVLRDHLRLHRVDLGTGAVDSVPILGAGPYAWRPVDAGRGVLWVSLEGPTIRVDGSGAQLVTPTQTSCLTGPGSGGLEVSPDGRWAAWACRPVDDGTGDTFQQSVVLRASAGGIERFEGVPMVVLSIDDDGNILLYSTESSDSADLEGVELDGKPLSLWALSDDSVLGRVHSMEPTPQAMLLLAKDQSTFIQAAPIR